MAGGRGRHMNVEHPAPDRAGDATARRWSFGAVEFDERSFELKVGGLAVDLERKSLEVLRLLLHRAGEVVTKDELLEAVWPGRIVSESVPPKAISRIREVIGDADQALIKTVHGYGYRLVAPVTVQAVRAAAPPKLDLAPGDHPPLRPLWSLVRRLGTGGQGEVWLAGHDKTGDERVYKFAYDLAGLSAIKREITLYRVLRDTLGRREDIVAVMDWNLEEAPYFIELEHVAAGNLEAWATQRVGGLAAVPLTARLELVARIADALAAANSVGVLHKDLKPSNVLIGADARGAPTIKLTDFGSGGVVDSAQVAALGITQLGFTRSVATDAAGTPIYTAPEVIAGQPCTVQGDIYSLGVVLYQMAAGNLREPLAPGWEDGIEDELLREDIRAAVDRNPARRLPDASLLATRLRTLEDRRRQRAAERAERERLAAEQRAVAERARAAEIALARFRARRNWMLTSLSVLIVGMAISVSLYVEARRARNEATRAALSSQTVADFLSKDMFAQVGGRPIQGLTVKELLDAATESLKNREAAMPEAAAQIHFALGNAYFTMNSLHQAEQHLDRALAGYEQQGAGLGDAARAAARSLRIKITFNVLPSELEQYQRILDRARARFGGQHAAVLDLGAEIAFVELLRGQWARAAANLGRLVEEARATPTLDVVTLSTLEERHVAALIRTGAFQEAVTAARSYVDRTGEIQRGTLAAGSAHVTLASALLEVEQFDDAEAELQRGITIIRPWTADETSGQLVAARFVMAELRLRERRYAEAIRLGEEIAATVRAWPFNPQKLDMAPEPLIGLARAYLASGKPVDAVRMADRAIAGCKMLFPEDHPVTKFSRLVRAEALAGAGRRADARAALEGLGADPFAALGPDHPYLASQRRVEGLLALAEGRIGEAATALREARRIFEKRYGQKHWFAQRARAELARADPSSTS
jgi:eukaryotic-like serine/threonine-protein kinase